MTELSRSDKQMVGELEEGRERLLAQPWPLLSNLRRKLQSITRNIYVFDWIPEQTEDLYRVLVDGTIVVHMGIPHDMQSDEVIFEKWSVREYLNGQKTRPKGLYLRKFQIALRLAERTSGDLSP